jgi:hypothetical protein
MAAIAHKCGAGLLACVVFGGLALRADPQREILDLFTSMLAALSDDNVPGFMSGFDRDMPGYGKLKSQIAALVEEADVASDIEPVKDSGDQTHHTIDLDWYLTIRSAVVNGPTVYRRQVIHVELRKDGKHWRIVSIAPLDFFAPAKLGARGQ